MIKEKINNNTFYINNLKRKINNFIKKKEKNLDKKD